MPIEKIQKQGRADMVFEALRKEILDGTFQTGEKIPSAGNLSRQFGVSLATIKAALQRLAVLGLIETRVGEGSFVLAFDPNRYLTQVSDFLFTENDITQLSEFRFCLEMAIVRLAIKKASQGNFQRMEQLLYSMDESGRKNDIELHGRLDYQFHLEIAKATGNNLFILTYEMMEKLVCRHITVLNNEFFRKPKDVEDVHWRLLRAIKDKDIDACRQCYVEMLYFMENSPPAGPLSGFTHRAR
jgi:GntR family transcriptional repressor for pyruvate dehydrogenase complex